MKIFFGYCLLVLTILLMASCQEDENPIESSLLNNDIKSEYLRERTCLSVEHTQHLLLDPDYRKSFDARMRSFEKFNANALQKSNCATPILIPVAIHYQGVTSPDAACLRQLAIDQINRVNLDFTGENIDISKWAQASSQFSGVSNGEMCVSFVIADKNHPNGYGLNNGDLAITINKTQGDQLNDWPGYLNIFVQPNSGGLGYAPYGGVGNGDGVVIDVTGFGAGSGCGAIAPEAPFNLGRTLTHEIGHYLLLEHIWGDGCGVDDEVSDTPNQEADYSGCPNLGASSCGSVDMHMNYMDYVNDMCMYMFSAGQVSRMTSYLQASLNAITSNVSNVYSGSSSNPDDNSENCTPPANVSASVQGVSSVKISWTSSANARAYILRYRKQGENNYITRDVTSNETIIQGLTSNTTYEVGVQSSCSTTTSSYTANITFTTQNDGSGSDDNEDPIDEEDSDQPIEDDNHDEASEDAYRIVVTLDDYGSETTWTLYDEENNLIDFGGPYEDGQDGVEKSTTIFLTNGCYEIDIFDEYGDGICCEYGHGSFEVLDSNNERLAFSDGQYGKYELIQFCIEDGLAKIVKQERDTKKLFRGKKK